MKQRLLVMNGQKLIQTEENNKWQTKKIEKANGVRPGIYNIYNASEADSENDNIGEVIHFDKKNKLLYQKNGNQFIRHDSDNIGQIPTMGSFVNIRYDNNKATTNEVPKNKIKLKI